MYYICPAARAVEGEVDASSSGASGRHADTVRAPLLAPRLVPKDVLNIEGALYFCTFFMGIVNSLAVQPVLAAERTVFARERASRMYSSVPYALSLVRIYSPCALKP